MDFDTLFSFAGSGSRISGNRPLWNFSDPLPLAEVRLRAFANVKVQTLLVGGPAKNLPISDLSRLASILLDLY